MPIRRKPTALLRPRSTSTARRPRLIVEYNVASLSTDQIEDLRAAALAQAEGGATYGEVRATSRVER
jgi:hypothetical protein